MQFHVCDVVTRSFIRELCLASKRCLTSSGRNLGQPAWFFVLLGIVLAAFPDPTVVDRFIDIFRESLSADCDVATTKAEAEQCDEKDKSFHQDSSSQSLASSF